jgi:polyisoprenoid-binding protein YceI
LLEEHFNENYMESSKIPKATFKGKTTNLSAVNFNKEGTYNVSVEGDLTLHGVTQKITAPGTISVKAGKINAASTFKIKIKDYGIKIPTLVADKIAEVVEIKVNCLYEQKK